MNNLFHAKFLISVYYKTLDIKRQRSRQASRPSLAQVIRLSASNLYSNGRLGTLIGPKIMILRFTLLKCQHSRNRFSPVLVFTLFIYRFFFFIQNPALSFLSPSTIYPVYGLPFVLPSPSPLRDATFLATLASVNVPQPISSCFDLRKFLTRDSRRRSAQTFSSGLEQGLLGIG